MTTLFEHGYAVLEINPATIFDHGEYTILAVNTLGEARQTAVVEVVGLSGVSESATNYIQQDLVAAEPASGGGQFVPIQEPKALAPGKDRPNFHKELRSQELFVGQPLHLETKLTPINDSSMTLQFTLNGTLIQPNERIQIQYSNGYGHSML